MQAEGKCRRRAIACGSKTKFKRSSQCEANCGRGAAASVKCGTKRFVSQGGTEVRSRFDPGFCGEFGVASIRINRAGLGGSAIDVWFESQFECRLCCGQVCCGCGCCSSAAAAAVGVVVVVAVAVAVAVADVVQASTGARQD